MANVTLGGTPVHTSGILPLIESKAPNFKLTTTELGSKSLSDYSGYNVVLNIFPSVDTGTCATSIREFNKAASTLENTKVLCISKDLPFAMARFCGAEGLDNVENLSDFRDGNFGKTYGLDFTDGPFEALLSRCVIIINTEGIVKYTEQVSEIADEPNYEAALSTLS